MKPAAGAAGWQRRAQPLLGTLVDISVWSPGGGGDVRLVDAGFDALRAAQACLSRFDAASDVSRFHALRCGESLAVRETTRQVLQAAGALQADSGGLFDIRLGSARDGWALTGNRLEKRHAAVRLDFGGIGKGHAVDLAVLALQQGGCRAGWVNAGGDLRAFGDIDVPVLLRDDLIGGVRAFAQLRDGAFASSAFGPGHRAQLAAAAPRRGSVQVSVAAPLCLWADALTKIVAGSGDAAHPLLARHGARAWLH